MFKTLKNLEITGDQQFEEISEDPTNEDLLLIIDTIYIQSKKALNHNNHEIVLFTLDSLITFDVSFRKIIAHQLTGPEDHEILSEGKLNFAVLMQAYYNGFRINLLSDIVTYLNNHYNQVATTLTKNFQKAMNVYKYASDINAYYINGLKSLYKARTDKYDQNTEKIFVECVQALNEIRNSSADLLRNLFASQYSH